MIPFTSNPRLTTAATTLLRVAVGGTLMAHGWLKAADMDAWQNALGHMGVPAPEISAYLSMGAELIGGGLLVLGALTPIAAIVNVVNMAVAILAVHWEHGFFAKDNGFEFPLLLLVGSLFFLLAGPGPLSIDHWIRNQRDAAKKNQRWRAQDAVTNASEESFPASDAPGYNPGRV